MATQIRGRAGQISTPKHGFQFEVYTQNSSIIPRGTVGFSEVDGLTEETDSQEYKDGNDLYARMIPGMTKSQELTLSRGVDESGALLQWRELVREGTFVPQAFQANLIIIQFGRAGTDRSNPSRAEIVRAIRFERAWPKSYALNAFNGTSSEIILERVVFCYDGPMQVLVGQTQFPTSRTESTAFINI